MYWARRKRRQANSTADTSIADGALRSCNTTNTQPHGGSDLIRSIARVRRAIETADSGRRCHERLSRTLCSMTAALSTMTTWPQLYFILVLAFEGTCTGVPDGLFLDRFGGVGDSTRRLPQPWKDAVMPCNAPFVRSHFDTFSVSCSGDMISATSSRNCSASEPGRMPLFTSINTMPGIDVAPPSVLLPTAIAA